MNLVEALTLIMRDPKKWARPTDWIGHKTAICYSPAHPEAHLSERFEVVPDKRGGAPFYLKPWMINATWEVVDPDTVLEEVKDA